MTTILYVGSAIDGDGILRRSPDIGREVMTANDQIFKQVGCLRGSSESAVGRDPPAQGN